MIAFLFAVTSRETQVTEDYSDINRKLLLRKVSCDFVEITTNLIVSGVSEIFFELFN